MAWGGAEPFPGRSPVVSQADASGPIHSAAGANSRKPTLARGDRGFLRDALGRYTTFRFAGSRSTLAQKINDRGQIVGAYNNPNAAPRPPPATAPSMGRIRLTTGAA